MNANCRELRPLLSAYMDNELTPEELRGVQAHVSTCAECAAVLQEYRQVRSSMRSLSQPVPPAALRAAVFAKATPAYRRRAAVFTFGQRGLSYTAIAAATIAIFFTAALLLRSGLGPGVATQVDTTPPRIDSLNLQPNVDSWGLNSPIRITFNEPMDQASVIAALNISADPPLSDEERQRLLKTATWEGNTLVIGGGVALQPYTDYTITIDTNRARDTAQNTLQGGNNEFAFRTVDVVVAGQTPTAIIASVPVTPSPTASPTAMPTATPRPTEPTIASTNAVPLPTQTPQPSAAPVPTSTPTTTAAVIPPVPSSAPSNPPAQPTPTPTMAVPTPTPTTPTATPQPTSTPTETPPTPTVPAPTATTPPPTATPVRSPFTTGQTFAPVYESLAERLGLPTANETAMPGAYLAFEGGWMLWRGDTRTVYVLFNEDPLVWYAFADGWVDGMEPGGGPSEQAGRYVPARGFGKVWSENPDVQRRLGFALTPNETSGTIAVQPFERGLMLGSNLGAPTIYVFYQNNTFEAYPR